MRLSSMVWTLITAFGLLAATPVTPATPAGAQALSDPQSLTASTSPGTIPGLDAPHAPAEASKAEASKPKSTQTHRQRGEQLLRRIGEEARKTMPLSDMSSTLPPMVLILIGLFAVLISRVAERLGRSLLQDGLIPSLLSWLVSAGRLVAWTTLAFLLISLFPSWLGSAVPWVFVAAAVAVGWSLRDLLSDVFLGFVLRVEHRVVPGAWVSGAGFSGLVERLGLRATWLTTSSGQRLAVPNHAMIKQTVVFRSRVTPSHQVEIRLATEADPERIRAAIAHAAMTSPFSALDPKVTVRHDPVDPSLWRVRLHLLHLNYAAQFDGEIFERTHAALKAETATLSDPRPPRAG